MNFFYVNPSTTFNFTMKKKRNVGVILRQEPEKKSNGKMEVY
jgi:hypothetical protein